jgi:hypothetical protein
MVAGFSVFNAAPEIKAVQSLLLEVEAVGIHPYYCKWSGLLGRTLTCLPSLQTPGNQTHENIVGVLSLEVIFHNQNQHISKIASLQGG